MHALQVIVVCLNVAGGAASLTRPCLQRHLQRFGHLSRDVVLNLEYVLERAVIAM